MRGSRTIPLTTKDMVDVNPYVGLFKNEFRNWVYDVDEAPQLKGKWREGAFQVDSNAALDLEIGTGTGYFFQHYATLHPERMLIGLELKFKPLIQTIRRTVKAGAKNGRIVRFNASTITEIFAENELNNVFVHFPDPWPKKRHIKNRLLSSEFLLSLHQRQKPGGVFEFKTDSRNYFDWALENMRASPYQIDRLSYDLHSSEWKSENFVTQFEQIFLDKGQPIHYALLRK